MVDTLFILPVFAAGEDRIKGFDSKSLVSQIRERSKKEVHLVKSERLLFADIKRKVKPND